MSHPRELGPNAASCPSNVGVTFVPNESQCNTEQALGHTGGVPSTRFSQPFHQVPPGCEQALLCASPHRIVSDCTPDCNPPPYTSQPAPCSCFQGGYKADEQPFIPFDCDRSPFTSCISPCSSVLSVSVPFILSLTSRMIGIVSHTHTLRYSFLYCPLLLVAVPAGGEG